MKHALTYLMLTFIPLMGFGQNIQNIEIIPANISTTDSVFAVVEIYTPSSPCLILNSNVSISGTDISMDVCYYNGLLATICNRTDTVFIGENFSLGNYNVSYTASTTGDENDEECSQSSSQPDTETTSFTVGTVGVNSNLANAGFQVHPNPVTDKAVIVSSVKTTEQSNFTVYDARGRLVIQEKVRHSKQKLDFSQLPAGVYTCFLENLLYRSQPVKVLVVD